jgi:hypothetical protein
LEVHGEGAMNEGNVRKWLRLFEEDRNNTHDEERSGRASIVIDDLKEEVNTEIGECRLFTISELHEKCLAGQCLSSEQETEDVVHCWLKGLAASWPHCAVSYLH